MGWCKTELPDDTHEWVKEMADQHNIRVDEVIRGCVEHSQEENEFYKDP